MNENISHTHTQIESQTAFVTSVFTEIEKVIVGQRYLLERLLIGILANGHLLVEGVPGLAKTLSIKTLANIVNASFQRIQFTPDLLPADVIGTLIFNQKEDQFIPKLGPIFGNIILADEINRAPAKVQSALLEAMQEQQVTIGETSHPLPDPFLVLATQNPIEQEGTYPLPEAQTDRFLMKLKLDYPSREEEKEILNRHQNGHATPQAVISLSDINIAKQQVQAIYIDDRIKNYVLDLIFATRDPKSQNLNELAPLIDYGASPRASVALLSAAKAHAFIQSRAFVSPEDIKAIGKDVLRHRIIPSFEAEAENMSADDIVDTLFNEVEVP